MAVRALSLPHIVPMEELFTEACILLSIADDKC